MEKNPKITICIPAYNAVKTIFETLASCVAQEYPDKEILVLDDGSTDGTADLVKKFESARIIRNEKNAGIGYALQKLMEAARGKYLIFLCADDVFTGSMVISDYVREFDMNPGVGVIGRYYYQFMNGYQGAIMVCRDRNIITQSCNPSGMAFRKIDGIQGTNKIFIEMPSIVAQYLPNWRWTMLEYDTVAARIHPGGNTGTKVSYYQGSQIENWVSLVGPEFRFHEGFIQIKNRAPKLLWQEIKAAWKLTPGVRKEWRFYLYATVAVLLPGWILRPLANYYRHRINRNRCVIIRRPE